MTLAAIVIALAGAGVLIVMWLTLPWPPDVHTWPDFRSGSFGDALLLPVAAAGLVGLRHSLPRRTQGIVGPIAAAAGAAIGALVQLSWFLDPSPPPTWTFTRAHAFSVAGAWHAAFFVVMSGVLAWLAAEFVAGAAEARRHDPAVLRDRAVSGAVSTVIASTVSFAGLVALDSAPSSASMSSSSTLVALGVVGMVVCGVLGWTVGEFRPAFLAAVLAGSGVVALQAAWPPSPLRLVAACLIVAASALPLRWIGVPDPRLQRKST